VAPSSLASCTPSEVVTQLLLSEVHRGQVQGTPGVKSHAKKAIFVEQFRILSFLNNINAVLFRKEQKVKWKHSPFTVKKCITTQKTLNS